MKSGWMIAAAGALLAWTPVARAVVPDPALEHRRAFRKAVAGSDASVRSRALAAGLKDADPLVRRQALWELHADNPARAFAAMERMLGDPSPEVGTMIAELGGTLADEPKRVAFLKRLMAATADPQTKAVAVRAMGFPFHRENVARSRSANNDHESVVVAKIDLPTGGWMFHHDRTGDAHLSNKPWYLADIGDWRHEGGWRLLSIGQPWESQGAGTYYDGIGWYRREFDLPARPAEGDMVELCFDGVDDEAWVWLNGTYVGQHDEGISGCGKPFRFDVERELKWGARNLIVVRVNDIGNVGGITKGIRIEVLK